MRCQPVVTQAIVLFALWAHTSYAAPIPVDLGGTSAEMAPIDSSTVISPVATVLDENLRPTPAFLKPLGSQGRAVLRAFYNQQGFQPVWSLETWQQTLDALRGFEADGLNIAAYNLQAINTDAFILPIDSQRRALADAEASAKILQILQNVRLGIVYRQYDEPDSTFGAKDVDFAALLDSASQGKTDKLVTNALPSLPEYQALRQLVIDLRHKRANGGYVQLDAKTLAIGSKGKSVKLLHARLHEEGESVDAESTQFGNATAESLRRVQRRYGLPVSGTLDMPTIQALNAPIDYMIAALLINMERLRRMPEAYAEKLLSVNVPEFVLELYDRGSLKETIPVITGRPERPSPALYSELTGVEFHPYWYVPSKLAVEDLIPLYRKNPKAFAELGIRVYNKDNKELNPASINWGDYDADNFPYRLRQDPGDDNSLGSVKFIFNNKFAVYLHDTPHPELFKRRVRALSSGCVRVSDPKTLANFVLEGKRNDTEIEKLFEDDKRVFINPAETISVRLGYLTARIAPDGQLRFSRDIYNRDIGLRMALQNSGLTWINQLSLPAGEAHIVPEIAASRPAKKKKKTIVKPIEQTAPAAQ